MFTQRPPRLAIFVDGANMFYAQKENGWFIDWENFHRFFTANRDVFGVFYFTATPSASDPTAVQGYRRFKRFLQFTGYRVIDKEVRVIQDKATGEVIRVKGNLDIELVFRMLATINSYDEMILVGGDADYIPVIEHLINLGKTVHVVGQKGTTAIDLINSANKFTDLKNIRSEIERNRQAT